MKELLKGFKEPERSLGIYPIVHDMGRKGCKDSSEYRQRVDRRLQRIHDLGYGGVVYNIHYTFDFPENESCWEDTAYIREKAEELGLKLWIYDENGYPSGTAGGAVLERHPEYEAKGLFYYSYWMVQSGPSDYRIEAPSGRLFGAYLIPEDPSKDIVNISHTADSRGVLRFKIPEGRHQIAMLLERELYDGTPCTQPWCPPRRYINPLDKRAVSEFINVTHENYYRYNKEGFGKSIKAFFMDEPMLMSVGNTPYPAVSFREDFPEKFKARYGYEIDRALIAVFSGKGRDVTKLRCDFWDFIADEYSRNFYGTIQDWCREHGVSSSGHLMEEENVLSHVVNYGSFYRCIKHMDIPGIDQLRSVPTELMKRDSIPFARLVSSAADVFGKREVMSEAPDHFSRVDRVQVPMDWIRASMNWHYAMGVNVITSYYGLYNRDYFSDEEIAELNDYVKRLGFILRKGERLSRTAILLPEASLWDTVGPAGKGGRSGKAEKIAKTLVDISWGLLDRQIEFDYIDEGVLGEAALCQDSLSFGSRQYKLLILPGIHVLNRTSALKIKDFAERGGKVACLNTLPQKTREGDDDSTVKNVFMELGQGIIYADADDPRLYEEIEVALLRDVKLLPDERRSPAASAMSPNILSHVRQDSDTKYIFLCNMAGATYRGRLLLKGGGEVMALDPRLGDAFAPEYSKEGDDIYVEVNLKPYAGQIFVVK